MPRKTCRLNIDRSHGEGDPGRAGIKEGKGLVVSNAPGVTNGFVNRPSVSMRSFMIINDKNIWETLGVTGTTG